MMFPDDIAKVLSQCTLVVDNAKSPVHSATQRAEVVPSLSPYKRTMKAKRATRQRQQQPTTTTRMESIVAPVCRWTAESLHCLERPLQHRQQHYERNTAPRKPGNDHQHEPQQDTISLKAIMLTNTTLSPPSAPARRSSLTDSPRMPSRKASFRLSKTTTTSPLDCDSPKVDSSPRKPKRRTAEILQEALDTIQICDLSSDDYNGADNAAPVVSSNHTTILVSSRQ